MADTAKDDDDDRPSDGRGPAYPYLSLEKAVSLAEKIRDAGVPRTPMPPSGYFKIWEFKGASGPARQTLAALKYYGFVEYLGQGKDRKVKLSELALRVVLDKVPQSPSRAAAIKEAALAPAIFADLYKQFPHGIGTDSGFETYLTLNKGYLDGPAKHIIRTFKATLTYAGLDKPANLPDETGSGATETPDPFGSGEDMVPTPPLDPGAGKLTPPPASENIKIALDGDRILVSANVDLAGARKLLKRLQANMSLLEDDKQEDVGG